MRRGNSATSCASFLRLQIIFPCYFLSRFHLSQKTTTIQTINNYYYCLRGEGGVDILYFSRNLLKLLRRGVWSMTSTRGSQHVAFNVRASRIAIKLGQISTKLYFE